MNWLMRKCKNCNRYVLNRDKCPYCGGELTVPHPPRFSPIDKYLEYRLKIKLEKGEITAEKPSYVP